MPWLLVIAFVVVPIVELAVILQVGDVIGVVPTIVLLVLDSVVGAILVRREGSRAWRRFREALEERRWPGDEVTQGALVLGGGALLLTPGFVTDLVGLAMVAPPTRTLLSRAIRSRLKNAAGGLFGSDGDPGGGSGRQHPGGRSEGGRGETLDVEVVSVERDQSPEREAPDDRRSER